MLWVLDSGSDEPLYQQLVSQVHLALAKGDLKPGERLPTARDLAESLDLNMHTVLHAYQKLRDDGVVETRRGRGTIIVQNTPHTQAALRRTLSEFAKIAAEAGLSPDAAATLLRQEMTA
jgi:GntR family transcriptional regulator